MTDFGEEWENEVMLLNPSFLQYSNLQRRAAVFSD